METAIQNKHSDEYREPIPDHICKRAIEGRRFRHWLSY